MKIKNWQEWKNKVHGVGVEHVCLQKKKKIPWDKLRHLLAKNIHQGLCNMQTNHHTRGAQWGDGRYRSGGWGRELTREWRGFPPSKWGEVEVWVDGLCHWLDDPKTESNSSASQETKSFLKFLLYCIIFSYLWILMKSPLPLWTLLSHVKWLHKK